MRINRKFVVAATAAAMTATAVTTAIAGSPAKVDVRSACGIPLDIYAGSEETFVQVVGEDGFDVLGGALSVYPGEDRLNRFLEVPAGSYDIYTSPRFSGGSTLQATVEVHCPQVVVTVPTTEVVTPVDPSEPPSPTETDEVTVEPSPTESDTATDSAAPTVIEPTGSPTPSGPVVDLDATETPSEIPSSSESPTDAPSSSATPSAEPSATPTEVEVAAAADTQSVSNTARMTVLAFAVLITLAAGAYYAVKLRNEV